MKRIHIIFCCNTNCVHKEMDDLIKATIDPIINMTERTIRLGEDEYRFVQYGNINKERFYGLLIHDYRDCGNYHIDARLKSILDTRIRRDVP
jgi:hypothetical protein